MVKNVHERVIAAPLEMVGGLLDRLASREDALWPRENWPPMRFDKPLAVGARGGHGPVGYFVEAYEPGRSVRFRFDAPRGFNGTHRFDVEELTPQTARLKHTLEMRLEGAARVSWPLFFRPLHDALVEDALDCAERFCASGASKDCQAQVGNFEKRRWSLAVRLLRRLTTARRRATKNG